MQLRTSFAFASALLVSLGTIATSDAFAAGVRVKCDKSPTRSSISVDGRDLIVGSYSAVVISGENQKSAPLKGTVGDEIEFDFDSNRNDILAGDTPISRVFIQGNRVTGQIVDEQGFVVVQGTATCRVRR